MPRIPEDTVQKVLDATDIVDLIGTHVQLKRAGSAFVGLCPFHNERTPSFNVNPQRQYYKCFGCDESGSAIGWLMNYENLPFIDAVKKLALAANIPITEEQSSPEEDKARKARAKLVELHNKTARFLHKLCKEHERAQHARDYLKSRNFSDEMVERWTIGWMPDQPRIYFDWVKESGFTARQMVAAGIAAWQDENQPARGIYLRFQDRLMFPIENDYGDTIAFSGRQLRENPNSGKYINSPETRLFKKAKTIFGLNRARRPMMKAKTALICEGQIDVIACHEAGIDHAIAGLGTAFTDDHAKLLRRFTDHATLCYDADSAGIKASSRAFKELAGAGISVRYAQMPKGEDPDTFIEKFGADAFSELTQNAPEFFDALINAADSAGTLANPERKAAFGHELADLLKSIVDPMARDTLVRHVATRIGVGTDDLRRTIDSVKTFRSRPREQEQQRAQPTEIHPAFKSLLHYSLSSFEVHEWLSEQGELLHRSAELPGAHLLRNLLIEPPLTTPSQVNLYLSKLNQSDRLALETLIHGETVEEPLQAAAETLATLERIANEKDLRALIAKMESPNLSPEARHKLMKEIAHLKSVS